MQRFLLVAAALAITVVPFATAEAGKVGKSGHFGNGKVIEKMGQKIHHKGGGGHFGGGGKHFGGGGGHLGGHH